MTKAETVDVHIAPLATLLALEIWGEVAAVEARLGCALPPPGQAIEADGRRILWWEPRTWLIRVSLEDSAAQMEQFALAAGQDGAVTDLSGGFARHRLEGEGWRELLMIGGVFDAESPAFAAGSMTGTVIHHMPVRLDVLSESAVEVYVPPSYADDLLHHWRTAIRRR